MELTEKLVTGGGDVTNPNPGFLGIDSSDVRGGMINKDVVKQAVSDVDIVYHLAINWNGHTWRHMLPLADLFEVNIRGTLNLLDTENPWLETIEDKKDIKQAIKKHVHSVLDA